MEMENDEEARGLEEAAAQFGPAREKIEGKREERRYEKQEKVDATTEPHCHTFPTSVKNSYKAIRWLIVNDFTS